MRPQQQEQKRRRREPEPPHPPPVARREQPSGRRPPPRPLLLPVLLLLALAAGSAGAFMARPPPSPSPSRRATRRRGPLMLARVPITPPQRLHTQVPVKGPGQHDLASLRTNQPLTGRVVGIYEGRTCRKLFLDAGVTRPDPKKPGRFFPVLGMVRLAGRYRENQYSPGQRVETFVDAVLPNARLTLSLTPVHRRPDVDPATGEALPTYALADLKVGMPLKGRVVSVTAHYAFVDCGVLKPQEEEEEEKEDSKGEQQGEAPRKRRRPGGRGRRRINGKLYRLDLEERFALSPKQKTARTEAVLAPGMDVEVFVKGVHLASKELSLTMDSAMTPDKARALRQEREARRVAMEKKQDVDQLLIGEDRKGVITKILPGGCKVGIGAKRTGFVSIESVAEAYGKEIRDLGKVLVVGGRMQVEVEEISDDGERIDLRCLEVFKQVAPTPPKPASATTDKKAQQASAKKAKAKAPSRYEEEEEDDEDDDGFYSDEEDDDDYNRLGYDDEW